MELKLHLNIQYKELHIDDVYGQKQTDENGNKMKGFKEESILWLCGVKQRFYLT